MKYFIPFIISILFLTSCEDEMSLQEYFVHRTEEPGFVTTSVPTSVLPIEEKNLSEQSQEALQSIKKANILYYDPKVSDSVTFQKEKKQIDKIMSGKRYTNLISHKGRGMKFVLTYDGDLDNGIDEMVLYGYADSMGLGVARILGDNMQPSKIVRMIKELQKDEQAGDLQSIMNNIKFD